MRTEWLLRVKLCVCGIALACADISSADDSFDRHAEILKACGVDATGPAALEFLSNQKTATKSPNEIANLITSLGAHDFLEREAADKHLAALGEEAESELRVAANSDDPEVRLRARRLVSRLKRRSADTAIYAALHVVEHKTPNGAVARLLEFLPATKDLPMQFATMRTLRAVAKRRDIARLRDAIQHKDARARSAAAYVLSGLATNDLQETLAPLLSDDDERVRLIVAHALLNREDRNAIATLLDLLAANDSMIREASMLMLRDCSGEKFAFDANASEEQRKESIAKCRQWFDDHEDAALHLPVSDMIIGPNLTNSVWRMVYELPDSGPRDHDVVFHPNGRLQVNSTSDKTDDDIWTTNGMSVSIKMNNAYVEYTATMSDYDTMSGTALNIKGVKWDWKATRVR